MENLFCDRDISNKFDLKGSERNRMVDPTNQNNQNGEIVLLDENLIQSKFLCVFLEPLLFSIERRGLNQKKKNL